MLAEIGRWHKSHVSLTRRIPRGKHRELREELALRSRRLTALSGPSGIIVGRDRVHRSKSRSLF